MQTADEGTTTCTAIATGSAKSAAAPLKIGCKQVFDSPILSSLGAFSPPVDIESVLKG
ncbi:hypothetical protein ABBQ38_007488 [Trebouxia sp. C0009 RCD-2024]